MRPYFERDGICIYHGRCEDVLPTLADGCAAMVLTDPPYGKTANEWDTAPDWGWLWPTYRRLTLGNAAMLLFGQDDFTAEMICSNRADYRYSWVWEHDRTSGFLDAARKPLRSHQDIATFYRAQPTYNPLKWQGDAAHGRGRIDRASRRQSANYGRYAEVPSDEGSTEKHPRTVLYFPKPHPSPHPNGKPVALMEYLIRTYTNPGDLVLDPYAGSGPVAAAALRAGRRCVAIEGEEGHCETAAGRLQQAVLPLGAA